MTIRVAFRMVTPRGWTGGLNYLLNMCRILRAHASEFEPVFFAPADIDDQTKKMIFAATGSPPLVLTERTHARDASALFGIGEKESLEAFRSAKIDLLFESTGYYGPRLPFPVISWLPDFQHRQLPELFSRRAWWTREARFQIISRTRGHILLSSEDAHSDMLRFYGASNALIHVAPFTVLMSNFPTYEEGERARLHYNLPERFVFLPNQFWLHKNHRIVIEALGFLRERAPLIVASGGGDHRSPMLLRELQGRLSDLGATDRFRNLGHIPYSDVLALNARADALLNPSLFEGWSTTVEEAKALGTPLILSDLAVHREQVVSDGIFFNPRSAEECARVIEFISHEPPRNDAYKDDLHKRRLSMQTFYAERLSIAFMAAINDFHS